MSLERGFQKREREKDQRAPPTPTARARPRSLARDSSARSPHELDHLGSRPPPPARLLCRARAGGTLSGARVCSVGEGGAKRAETDAMGGPSLLFVVRGTQSRERSMVPWS